MAKQVQTDDAPSFEALGLPISQAQVHNDTVYVSGQVGIDPETGELVDGGVRAQTEQTLANIEAILEAAGISVADIVKATVFVEDMSEIQTVNEVYETFMAEPYPARSAVEVSNLALDCEVEIEVTAGV